MSDWLCPRCGAPTEEGVLTLPNGTVIRGFAAHCDDCHRFFVEDARQHEERILALVDEAAAEREARHEAGETCGGGGCSACWGAAEAV